MRANFITIHGIDGTGKSSVAIQLAESLNKQAQTSVFYDDLIGEAGGMPDVARGGVFDGKLYQSSIISQALANGRTVTRDRWLIDVFASETFKGEKLPSAPREILWPDLSVVLLCEESVRQKRIRLRPSPTSQDLIPRVEGTRADYFEKYLLRYVGDFAIRSIIIDTTHNTPAETTAAIISELETSHGG
jgi:thymidylate kinase